MKYAKAVNPKQGGCYQLIPPKCEVKILHDNSAFLYTLGECCRIQDTLWEEKNKQNEAERHPADSLNYL